jgi:6-phosphogluconolactonase (cycloisomerase 2 family)
VLNNQISDTGGDALTPITFNFTTGDFTSPVASILTPSNNATNVSVNPSLQIHFSKAVENVNPANITLHTGSLYGPAVAIESITAGANNTYSITPAGALNSLTTYYLDLSGGITDNGGNPLSFTNFSFTTGDFTAPTVVMLSPTNNATKVNYGVTDFSIVVQFSKPVQNVSSNTISVCSDSTSSGYCWPINFIMPQPNNTYEIHLYQYNSQTQYFVKLSSGITDNYGNALAPVTFNFTTDLELNNIQNLAFNGQSAYLVNLTNTVTQCAIESSNGALDNCQQATNNISGSGSGIAFNNDYAYVSSATQYGNSVFKCTVNNNGGELVGCSPATTSTSLAQDIGFYNSMAYIVNYTSNQITQCTPDSGGLFNNCTATGSGFDAPVGIAFANSYAYIANESSATVSQCSITGTGAFGTCNTTGSHFDSPVKIAINGNYAYISNYYSSTITQCTINSVNGNLTNCNKIGNQLFNFPLGIKFNNGYTYIAEAGNRTITKCTVNNTNGSFSNCTTM